MKSLVAGFAQFCAYPRRPKVYNTVSDQESRSRQLLSGRTNRNAGPANGMRRLGWSCAPGLLSIQLNLRQFS